MDVKLINAVVQKIPTGWKETVKRRQILVKHRSAFTNVFHCCLHKTGSQWIRGILADLRTFRYSGLSVFSYEGTLAGGFDPRRIIDRVINEPFPPRTFVTPLYIDYENFQRMPKPDSWRAFFVTRDPRDLVVSWYFSMKKSHLLVPSDYLVQLRTYLNQVPPEEGLNHSIRQLAESGTFVCLQSWLTAARTEPAIRIVRYEDLIGDGQAGTFSRLFAHCDVHLPDPVGTRILRDHSFEKLSGRARGQEDVGSHYRKGVSGDWKNHLSPANLRLLSELTGTDQSKAGYL